mmetsp:Transcript_22524/g.56509  ORF Transcript_22524/g.56509 Transcript_22524/m.56509 type:complete len:370 (-) Transcript_22524:437-1546(-)
MLSRAVLLLSSRGIALRSLTALPSSAVVASSLSTSSSVPAYSASRGWHVTDAFSPCLPSAASPWMLSLGHLSKTKSNGFATVSSPTENPAASSNDADADADAHVHADETSNYSSQPSAAAAATSQKKNTASNAGTSAPHPDAENAGTFTDSYPGIASAPLSDEIIELLRAPVRDSAVAMLPTGGLFLPVATYRAILDRVFGVGGWALIGRGSFQFIPNSSKAIRDYALFAHGRFLVETTGEATVDRDGSLEAAKSLALSRCCKYLGIAADIQDPNWQQAWREKHAETVFAENRKTHQKRKIWKLRGEALPWPWTPVPLNATYGQRSNSNHGNSSSSSSWSPPPPSPPKGHSAVCGILCVHGCLVSRSVL